MVCVYERERGGERGRERAREREREAERKRERGVGWRELYRERKWETEGGERREGGCWGMGGDREREETQREGGGWV